MNHLVYKKGSHLYKKSSHLVRTPITMELSPSEMAVYQVGGEYDTFGYATKGIILLASYDNCKQVGYNCITQYLQRPNTLQAWRRVTSSHEPETLWYLGSYATSGASMAHAFESVEAYILMGAYKFTLPTTMANWKITNCEVSFTNGGGVECYLSPAYRSAKNRSLKGLYSFRTWTMPFYVSDDLYNYPTWFPQRGTPSDKLELLSDTGDCRSARDLWDFGSSSRDGGIATLTTPVRRTYNMGADTLNFVGSHNTFWITPFIDCEAVSVDDYSPYFWVDGTTTDRGYWASLIVWGVRCKVQVEPKD